MVVRLSLIPTTTAANVYSSGTLRVNEVDAQNLANTAWAFATLGQLDEKCLAALSREAALPVSEFNAQGIANTAWAFAKAGESNTSLFVALANAAKLNVKEFNTQNIANMTGAFATTGISMYPYSMRLQRP